MEKTFTADAFGGFDGELPLPKDATLGVYSIQIINSPNVHQVGGETFRVEEYKKPEFEVKVDAPTEPVMLGEKITATDQVPNITSARRSSQAKVKYKVAAQRARRQLVPAGRWDWFYEPGYWWFGRDYHWYPGLERVGLRRPLPSWWRAAATSRRRSWRRTKCRSAPTAR